MQPKGPILLDQEPADNGTGHAKQEYGKGKAIATVFFGDLFRAECTSTSSDRVSQQHVNPHTEVLRAGGTSRLPGRGAFLGWFARSHGSKVTATPAKSLEARGC